MGELVGILFHLLLKFLGVEDFWWFWPLVGVLAVGSWLLLKSLEAKYPEPPASRSTTRILDLNE